MPENSKKQSKEKNDPKEQRKRRGRQQPPTPIEKKNEKCTEVVKEPQIPKYEQPPPEFFQNLKRETDEIIKITEEVNSKYKNKEIQSNWAKYEMPIESYEEIDEQENFGADYETLAQAPLSLGGHFQFKHEKSWDINTGPSLYDKYFDINMENLNIALSTIPFFERNGIEQSVFSETDIQNMNHRATKFKQKYYNDKKYKTPDIEAEERIINNLIKSDDDEQKTSEDNVQIEYKSNEIVVNEINNSKHFEKRLVDEVPIKFQKMDSINDGKELNIDREPIIEYQSEKKEDMPLEKNKNIQKYKVATNEKLDDEIEVMIHKSDNIDKNIKMDNNPSKIEEIKLDKSNLEPKDEKGKNPVIETPEDLEKWLDDFLDG